MKLVNRNIACIALMGLMVVAGCSKPEPPTSAQNPVAADANLSTDKFVATLQSMKPEERQVYCAQHKGVLMRISYGHDEALKQKITQLITPVGK